MPNENKGRYGFVLLIVLLPGFAAIINNPLEALRGLAELTLNPARLISDFIVIGGTDAALLNLSLVGLLAFCIVRFSDVELSGPTFAAIFTCMGFSLFGKTLLNTIPIISGVFLAAKMVKKPVAAYVLIALFGTALGPLCSFIIFEAGIQGPPAYFLGISSGILAGLMLPALAMAMLRLHEGYNLYNVGLTSGFLALFAAALFAGAGHPIIPLFIWNTESGPLLVLLVPVLSLLCILRAFYRKPVTLLFSEFLKIQKMSGRLPSDFVEAQSMEAALLNTGLLGSAGWLYVYVVGGVYNGPVLGGLLTLMGFACFGKTFRNCWPIALGVIASALVFGRPLNEPIVLLALLFGTTLAPLAGEFGPLAGFAAGFLHFALVDRTASWYGGLALYNNGFSGGLVATFIVALIEWRRSNKPESSRSRQ